MGGRKIRARKIVKRRFGRYGAETIGAGMVLTEPQNSSHSNGQHEDYEKDIPHVPSPVCRLSTLIEIV